MYAYRFVIIVMQLWIIDGAIKHKKKIANV